MKYIHRAASLLALLLLAACGTFQVGFIPVPTPTAYVNPTPTPPAYNLSPAQCAQNANDRALPDNPDDPHSYIGLHLDVGSLPLGLVFRESTPIDDFYQWQHVSRPELDLEFITQTLCTRPDGTPYTVIVDAVQIPTESEGYGRAGFCLPDRASGPFIVFGKFNSSQPQVSLDVEKGWAMTDLDFGMSIDLGSMLFVPYPINDLQCLRLERQGG